MKLTESELISFALSIPSRCEMERDLILQGSQGAWDTRVRKSFAQVLDGWFRDHFRLSSAESKGYVYAEGYNPIPNHLRGRAFFGTTMHPDAALFIGNQPIVALELDHGIKGSQIRNALVKASFSVLLGGYKRAMVLFFVDKEKTVAHYRSLAQADPILRLYREHFKTTLHIV